MDLNVFIQSRSRKYGLIFGFWALVVIIVVYAVFPFYYAILSSLKAGSDGPPPKVTAARPSVGPLAPDSRFA